ncbi:MAG TPA: pyridoxamine 5'-phosphate oxidase [Longimicrobiales bacterium]|nr:pyridoxamine 5'-phosphate oxidase [Longimicrobiales bacterium]
MSLKSSIRTAMTLGKGVVVGIPEASVERDPIDLFREWFSAARESGLLHPDAMALATADASGAPSVRMVLLKAVDERGFVFYTNYDSRKAAELEASPRAALCAYWAVLERQVRVEGSVERVSEEESQAYFSSRPRGSRIGAWASRQSQELPDRSELEERVRTLESRYAGEDVPLPPFWGGYLVRPSRIEFWQGRADRLHDRLVFERREDGWQTRRLYP